MQYLHNFSWCAVWAIPCIWMHSIVIITFWISFSFLSVVCLLMSLCVSCFSYSCNYIPDRNTYRKQYLFWLWFQKCYFIQLKVVKEQRSSIMAAKRQRKTSWPSTRYNFQRHPCWHTSPTQTLPHNISMVSWSSATSWRPHTGNMNLLGTMTYLSLSIVLWPCHNHGHLRMQNMFI